MRVGGWTASPEPRPDHERRRPSIVRAGCRCSSIADLVESCGVVSPGRRGARSPVGPRLPARADRSSRTDRDGRGGMPRSSSRRRSRPRPRPSNPPRRGGGPADPICRRSSGSPASRVTAVDPLGGRRRQDARLARPDHLAMGADRVGDDRAVRPPDTGGPSARTCRGSRGRREASSRRSVRPRARRASVCLVPGHRQRRGSGNGSGNRSQITRSRSPRHALRRGPFPDRDATAPGPAACSPSRSRRGRAWPSAGS